jgi:hypothetical protein
MHEYKVVPAPARAVKVRGLKTTEERFAHLLTETLNTQAADGWDYLRSETLPCTERKGLTGTRTTTQVVLIFRRALNVAAAAQAAGAATLAPSAAADDGAAAQRPRAEPVFRPGALLRGDGGRTLPPLRAVPPMAVDGSAGEAAAQPPDSPDRSR